ncbi:hypothetical protein Tco_1241999, partial [Tanacetum coccineum]
ANNPEVATPTSLTGRALPGLSLCGDKGVETQEKNALAHSEKHHIHTKETHGLSDDIDANTPVGDVKGPNVFERVKEEIEAIREAIHHKDDKNQGSPSNVERNDASLAGSKHEKKSSLSEEPKSPMSHHKETHGRGDDIDADIPISEFKGPSIFHRAKEEIEALVDTIHSKKESDHEAESPKKEGGFRASIKGKLHKIRNRD